MSDRSDEELLGAAIRNIGRNASPRGERWVFVKDLFAVGSTTAVALCWRFGVSPSELLGTDPLKLAGYGECAWCNEVHLSDDLSEACAHCGEGPLCNGCVGITEHMCSADDPPDDDE